MSNVGVIGAGAFGTALACALARGNTPVTLWARAADQVNAMNQTRENAKYLPDVALPDGLRATNTLSDLANMDAVLLVVPAQTTRAVIADPFFETLKCPVLLCAKGLERDTGKLQSDIVAQTHKHLTTGVISGPGFAREIATGKPTALTLGFGDPAQGEALQSLLSTPTMRLYLSDDPLGAQLGGALKNVFAIACGIVAGAGLGESAQAALLTRGFAELTLLASKMGARAETLSGLSGFGDLVLSCTSKQSRNFSFGYQVGQSADFSPTNTVEGIATASAISALAKRHNIDMPICFAVSEVLSGKLSVQDALVRLMTRPLRREA